MTPASHPDSARTEGAGGGPGRAAPPRKLYRSSEGRWLGGVAQGLAGHLALPVMWVRIVFALLCLSNGIGLLVYAAFWITVPLGAGGVGAPSRPAPQKRTGLGRWRPDRNQILTAVVLIATAVTLADTLRLSSTSYLWPVLLIGAGVVIVWRQADDARRAHWAEMSRRRGLLPLARSAAGVLLVAVGVTGIVVEQGSAGEIGPVLEAALVVLIGVALLTGPYLVRMMQDLSEERLMRIRAQERAEIAAHVHDSVLHTLTLIQRNADSPREVTRLARSQERELRNWLYRPQQAAPPGQAGEHAETPRNLADSVRATAAGVEDHHGTPVEVVCVGDCPLDERLTALVQAAREAMVNAAKYGGGGGAVQVYAEVEGEQVFLSVRDRGPGFDPAAVPEDRMGVRESIIGRMRRNGGTARLRSEPGKGTEVELEMERGTERRGAADS